MLITVYYSIQIKGEYPMRNKLLIGAAILVVLASVAYAAFIQLLSVEGTGTASGTWNVKITDVKLVAASSQGASDASAPSIGTGTSVTFHTNLAYPGAHATYQVTVTNNGSIPAKLDSINTTPTNPNMTAPTYITYNYSGVTPGTTTIAAGATNVMTVVVTWADSAPTTANESKTVTYDLNYSQST